MFKVLKHIKKITNDYSSILKYYIGSRKKDTLKTLFGPENIALDLCYLIVGVHSFNMLFLNEYERWKSKYKEMSRMYGWIFVCEKNGKQRSIFFRLYKLYK